MSHVITCPSGLTGRVRGMKVREERILADRKLAKSGGQVDELLGACWEETLDPGPYDFGDKGTDWGAVLQGDRFYALLQVRALTYGLEYAFALGCQNDGCRARFEWELDLGELPVRRLGDESRAAFTAGNRFETTLPDAGVRVWFRLFTGADERRLPQLRRSAGDRILSAMLGWRARGRGRAREGQAPLPRGPEPARRRLPRRRVRPGRLRRGHGHRGRVPRVLHRPGGGAPFRPGVLPAWEGEDGEAPGPEQLFPRVSLDGWREGLFQLCWRQHGGSGLGATLSEALDLSTTDRDWLLERVGQQRQREAREIEKAGRKR